MVSKKKQIEIVVTITFTCVIGTKCAS